MASKKNKVKQHQQNIRGAVLSVKPTVEERAGKDVPLYKKILIFVLSIILLLVVKRNNELFFSARINAYWKDFKEQRNSGMDPESRKIARYGNSYYIATIMAKLLKEHHAAPDDVVLMPSTGYYKSVGLDFGVPEPSVFYLYTGIKTSWPGHKLDPMPEWFINYHNGRLYAQKIQNKMQLDSILNILKPFPSHL